MSAKTVLFISGSIGLGHVVRDLAIARELRKQHPELELSWLAAPPANQLIEDAGERLLPEAVEFVDESAIAERAATGAGLNLIRYAFGVRKDWSRNVDVVTRVTSRRQFDLVIGDETYEIILAYRSNPRLKTCPFVMIYDFVGFDSMTSNPFEKLGVYFWNRAWSKDYRQVPTYVDLSLFVGEIEDVPDRSFGLMLPNRRDWARRRCQFVGHILPFDPAEYSDQAHVRSELGYGDESLVIGSIGGTAIGRQLLELCGQTYPILREQIPDLRMVLVGGPRLASASLAVPDGVETRGYVPELYAHLAASDLAIVQGGATTTLELTALRRPFLFFPIEGHCEQEVSVAARLARHQAGTKMVLSRTTPRTLASAISSNIGRTVTYPPIATDGARRAADLISELLNDRRVVAATGS
jgi:UDP:flavonoid glycosyltransferase YjiC (YdhE family)